MRKHNYHTVMMGLQTSMHKHLAHCRDGTADKHAQAHCFDGTADKHAWAHLACCPDSSNLFLAYSLLAMVPKRGTNQKADLHSQLKSTQHIIL